MSFYKSGKSLKAGIWLSERSSSRKAVEWPEEWARAGGGRYGQEVAEPWPVRFWVFHSQL